MLKKLRISQKLVISMLLIGIIPVVDVKEHFGVTAKAGKEKKK